MASTAAHGRAYVLPSGELRDVWVVDGRFAAEPPDNSDVRALWTGAPWLTPGLVDSHAHLALFSPAGDEADERERVRASALRHRDAGVLAIREPGSPGRASADLHADDELPHVVTAGRFLAPPGRYFPGLAREVAPSDIATAAAEEAAAGGGWIKLIGDFPIPGAAVEPNWSRTELAAAADSAHANGARAAIHATHPATIADAVEAGFDSIEHGTGTTPELVELMDERGVAWVPTLTIADAVRAMAPQLLGPAGATELIGWWEQLPDVLALAARRPRITLLAGTDAGMVAHGLVATEVRHLLAAGVPPESALAAASWTARRYLGLPGVEDNAVADFVVYPSDPRADPDVLEHPALIARAGRLVAAGRDDHFQPLL